MFSYDFDENYAEVPIDWRENWKTHSWLLPHHHRVGISFYLRISETSKTFVPLWIGLKSLGFGRT